MTGRTDNDDRVAEARRVSVIHEVERRGIKLRRSGSEMVGPCPVCGGTDRFSVNARKNVWHCRKGGGGGDAIALVEYLDACDFLSAVETLAGAAPAPDATRRKRHHTPPAANDADNPWRRREIGRAREIWDGAREFSVAQAYLKWRGVKPLPGGRVRGTGELAYYARLGEPAKFARIYAGPAMVAAIGDGAGRFIGCHITWIDPRILIEGFKGPSSGKAEIWNPETGEQEPSKKVRGSARGGHIRLGGALVPKRLVIGEGIETTLTVAGALLAEEDAQLLDQCAFWAAVSLGNLGGKALATVRHPTLKRLDKLGRARPVNVPGPYPLMDAEAPQLMPPDSAVDVLTLGDGDSDRFTGEMAHARAAARWARPGRCVNTAWAPDDSDFNDLVKGAGP